MICFIITPSTKADASTAFAGAGEPSQETRMMEMQAVERPHLTFSSAPPKRAQKPTA
jgi:hypothetical protein